MSTRVDSVLSQEIADFICALPESVRCNAIPHEAMLDQLIEASQVSQLVMLGDVALSQSETSSSYRLPDGSSAWTATEALHLTCRAIVWDGATRRIVWDGRLKAMTFGKNTDRLARSIARDLWAMKR